MGNKTRKPVADSNHGVPKVGSAAASAIQNFYDKLVELPLDENSPKFFTRKLITRATVETVGLPNLIRQKKNEAILLSVIDVVLQKPEMLTDFCEVLDSIGIAEELAQQIKGKYEELKLLEENSVSARLSLKKGPVCCERMFQGWYLVLFLLVAFLGILALFYLTAHLVTARTAEWQARVPPIPTAFTGREEEIQRIVHFVGTEHVSIVSITGGPAYGKSSLAIVSSHRIMGLGFPVYYVSLSEANSIQTFIMAFMHSTAFKKIEEAPHKNDVLYWISSLRTNTVIVLDNADHLTLNEQLRNEFLVLLKEAVAASGYVHLIVTTRYRFKIADEFEDILVQPLESPEAVALLSDLLTTKGTDRDASVDLEIIVNKTGGIPLAIKVVGRLLKSKAISGAEIIKELSINPLNTLSKESFTPDEQLRHCFDLSFKYLRPREQQCFHYASMFPGSFNREARDAIITAIVGDESCLEHLVDRSLVEYSYLASRYSMHSLLRAFAKDSMTKKYRKQRYFRLFTEHYMALLSDGVKEARASGNISKVYTTIVEDYPNLLHVMQLYVNGTITHSLRHADVLAFALDTFDIMQPRFPRDVLAEWWPKILNTSCYAARLDLSSSDLIPQFLKLSTKFGQLLLHNGKILLAKRILQFSDQCVRSIGPFWMDQCSHPHHNLYTAMLQVLKSVYEKDGVIHRALKLREQIYSCIMTNSHSWTDPGITMPEDVCSDGIGFLKQQVTRDSGDFRSVLMLIDMLFRCNMLSAARVELQRVESTFHKLQFHSQYKQFTTTVAVAKRFHLVHDYKKEVQWLTKADEFVQDDSSSFGLHFKLTRLYWHKLDNQEQAIKHGKTAYHFAVRLMDHDAIFQASIRLADILHQADGRYMDAGKYFEEALDRLPFIHAGANFIFMYQEFIVGHLLSIYYQSSQYVTLFKHYGQWAELEMSRSIQAVRGILDLPYNPPISSSTGLTETDDSLDHILGIGSTARLFLNYCVIHVYRFTFFYTTSILILIAFFICCTVLLIPTCILCILAFCTTITIVTLLFTFLRYSFLLPMYCVHYFLFHAFTKHKLWVPHKVPVIPKPIVEAFWGIFVCVLLCTPVIAWMLAWFGLYLDLTHNDFVATSSRRYHNMTMDIRDDDIYLRLF